MTQYYTATVDGEVRVGELFGESFCFLNTQFEGDFYFTKKLTDLTPVKFVPQDAVVIEGNEQTAINMTIREGLNQLDNLESRFYPRGIETEEIRKCLYALGKQFHFASAYLTPPKPRPVEPKTYGSVIKAVGEELTTKKIWTRGSHSWISGETFWLSWDKLSDIEILFIAPEEGE